MFDPYMTLLLNRARRQDLADEYRRARSMSSGVRVGYRRLAAACTALGGWARPSGDTSNAIAGAEAAAPSVCAMCTAPVGGPRPVASD